MRSQMCLHHTGPRFKDALLINWGNSPVYAEMVPYPGNRLTAQICVLIGLSQFRRSAD